jgi:predicted Zn finger-like uncharacterized protein
MIIPCEACYSTFRLEERFVKINGSLVRCSKCQKVFRVYPPKPTDPRNGPRVKTKNLIDYSEINKSGKLISHGMGIALDISEGGMLIETPTCINSSTVRLAATDNKKNLTEVKGIINRTQKNSDGMYLHGIKFIDSNERVSKFISIVIKEYNFRENNLTIKVKQMIKI